MRIDKIQLSWFRGASDEVTLGSSSKNVVVYGPNRSGKSSFVDAVEYLIRNGRIRHLSHEYSGRRQEKGIRNTHTPTRTKSKCSIHFDNGSHISAEIEPNGAFSIDSVPPDLGAEIQSWSLENHILRQDEVSRFIHLTKGEKYSVLLPLLGLDNLEYAAENLKRIQEEVLRQSRLEATKAELRQLMDITRQYFPSLEEKIVIDKLSELLVKYGRVVTHPEIPGMSKQLIEVINERIDRSKPENDRYVVLNQIHGESLDDKLDMLISAREKASNVVDALLDNRIAVLESTLAFTRAIKDLSKEITCPSCGRKVVAAQLAEHVSKELDGLIQARSLRDGLNKANESLAISINQTIERTKSPLISSWLNLGEQKKLSDMVKELEDLRPSGPRVHFKEEELRSLKEVIPSLMKILSEEVNRIPPPIKELINDLDIVNVCATVPDIITKQEYVKRVEVLANTLQVGEALTRDEITLRAGNIIKEISNKVQLLWSRLHPDDPVEGIHLYIPEETEKAIDIALKFHGVDQPSPRLTLSESFRNCLGLCIFLALALLRSESDHPILLDDIVSSMDREHRGMLVNLMVEDLAERQIILFTHDREWYTELRSRLPSADWRFMVLRPWENPRIGIQWSGSAYTFDDARALLPANAEACGNRVRAIMDGQLAIAAERMEISMPYLRGERNDRRTCVDFINKIIGEAPRRLKKKQGTQWLSYPDPISDWETARDLLIAWGDRASHTGSLVSSEAEQLIKACQNALDRFRCQSCGDYLWIADQPSREWVQCTCGELRWKYG